MNDIEAQLRATLTEQAGRVPGDGDALAQRILAAAEAPAHGTVLSPRRGWHTWTMPLLAAGAVATVVAAVVGIDHVRDSAGPPAVSHVVPAPTTSTDPAPTSKPSPTTTTPKPSRKSTGTVTTAPTIDLSHVTGFHAEDVTFASADHGWAVGSADCVRGGGRCSALFRTTDGTHWSSMPGTQFNLPDVKNCAAPCVEHIRFATDLIGYAYSPDALFMTIDGGLHWTQQKGRGADALETLDGNVIRLVSDSSGCPGPCNVRVERATVGRANWQTVQLGAQPVSGSGEKLARSGSNAYALVTRNPASGAGTQISTLFISTNDGESWTKRLEPCPQASGNAITDEVDGAALAAAPGHTLSLLCVPRDDASPSFVVVSHDGGEHFARLAGEIPHSAGADMVVGDPRTGLVAAGATSYRRTSGVAGWQRVTAIPGAVTFIGFESPTVGRAVTDGGRTIWTTRDAGRSWGETDFP